MATNSDQYLGYFKYKGRLVEEGILDISKAAVALSGFDEILRYFLIKEDPIFINKNIELPVKIKKGSWEVLLPLIDKLLTPEGIGTAVAGTYLTVTAKQAATDGLLQTGLAKDIRVVMRNAIISLQWVAKIAIHLGTFAKIKLKNVKFRNNEIGLPNDKGEYLFVPKKYFDIYNQCPDKLFSKAARIIEKERVLEIGYFQNQQEQSILISEKEKEIFYQEEVDEVLFPELKHGQVVELEGEITRGNEKTDTIGFEYLGHVLTCKPANGNLVTFKNQIISQESDHFFPKVKMVGIVDRTDKDGGFKDKRPSIIFSDIIPLENPLDETPRLFEI